MECQICKKKADAYLKTLKVIQSCYTTEQADAAEAMVRQFGEVYGKKGQYFDLGYELSKLRERSDI